MSKHTEDAGSPVHISLGFRRDVPQVMVRGADIDTEETLRVKRLARKVSHLCIWQNNKVAAEAVYRGLLRTLDSSDKWWATADEDDILITFLAHASSTVGRTEGQVERLLTDAAAELYGFERQHVRNYFRAARRLMPGKQIYLDEIIMNMVKARREDDANEVSEG